MSCLFSLLYLSLRWLWKIKSKFPTFRGRQNNNLSKTYPKTSLHLSRLITVCFVMGVYDSKNWVFYVVHGGSFIYEDWDFTRSVSRRGRFWTFIFSEVPVLSLESEWTAKCVLRGIDFASISMILRFDFWNVPTIVCHRFTSSDYSL